MPGLRRFVPALDPCRKRGQRRLGLAYDRHPVADRPERRERAARSAARREIAQAPCRRPSGAPRPRQASDGPDHSSDAICQRRPERTRAMRLLDRPLPRRAGAHLHRGPAAIDGDLENADARAPDPAPLSASSRAQSPPARAARAAGANRSQTVFQECMRMAPSRRSTTATTRFGLPGDRLRVLAAAPTAREREGAAPPPTSPPWTPASPRGG